MNDSVYFTDVTEELVAETFALAGTFDEAGDVDELDSSGDELVRAADFAEHGKAFIRHDDDALIRLDGAERIVRRLRFSGAGDCIKESGFSDVGETDDACA